MSARELKSPWETDPGPSTLAAKEQEVDRLIVTDSPNDMTNSIHSFLFDLLAFFSNCQSSLIADYCQEKDNVWIHERSLPSFHVLVGSNSTIPQR